jgi:DNA-directed RNA polymerase specialized sigma24 family protein
MASNGSVTVWLGPLQAGDPAAVQHLWERYFDRMVGLARERLQSAPRRAADEEDVALSAFNSFCRAVQAGRFPRLDDRDSLWRLLMTLTARKACHLVRDETRLKRGGAAGGPARPADEATLEQVLSREPDPQLAAEVAEQCEALLQRLGDGELRQIALWRMEGYTAEEIAGRLGCAARSVRRKLQLIRTLWEDGP